MMHRRSVAAACLVLLPACHRDSGSHFSTLPPGSQLPSDLDCAQRIRRSGFEPRPSNAAANHRVPTAAELQSYQAGAWSGYADPAPVLHSRVTGNFTGATDELI